MSTRDLDESGRRPNLHGFDMVRRLCLKSRKWTGIACRWAFSEISANWITGSPLTEPCKHRVDVNGLCSTQRAASTGKQRT
ncbi:MAG: hypothetical protein GY862_21480 [Gammaproteobacteria bacterium]|nr:hypothetical protein [Gammaproteobacteria bacterium]